MLKNHSRKPGSAEPLPSDRQAHGLTPSRDFSGDAGMKPKAMGREAAE